MATRPDVVLQLARYRFYWKVSSSLVLPEYAGSTLRGVYGRALRDVACVTRARECQGCVLFDRCPYPILFEPKWLSGLAGRQDGTPVLAPYAIEPEFPGATRLVPGDSYVFDMVLMTPQALERLPVIIAAWQRAFSKGVGPAWGKATLLRVNQIVHGDSAVPVYECAVAGVQPHSAQVVVPYFSGPVDVDLALVTPLRITRQGRLVREDRITAAIFLRQLIRRISFMINAHNPGFYPLAQIHQLNELADSVVEGRRELRWEDCKRYSMRQQQQVPLGGVMGRWQFLQVPAPLLPFLYVGQWLHNGKGAVFGLGRYQCQFMSEC